MMSLDRSASPYSTVVYRLPCEMCGGELLVRGRDFERTVDCPHCGEQLLLRFDQAESTDYPFASANVVSEQPAVEETASIGDCSKYRFFAASFDLPLACATAVVLALQLKPFGSVVQGVVSVAIFFLYYLVFEGVFNRTPGKYLFSLRVISLDGKPASWTQITIRTLWRFVEVNPLLIGAIPAAVFIVVSRTHRRIGDFFAKTLVVFEEG